MVSAEIGSAASSVRGLPAVTKNEERGRPKNPRRKSRPVLSFASDALVAMHRS